MSSLRFATERDYKQLRYSRPPFLTQYERDQLAWQRKKNRAIVASGLMMASILATVIVLASISGS